MNGIDRGINIAQYGTTAERTGLVASSIKPFSQFYDTDLSTMYEWHGRWDAVATGGGGGGGGAVTVADGADVTEGARADAAATWYSTAGSVIAKLGLIAATLAGVGSHVYGYTTGNLTTDAWTLFGTTRTKTYTYTGAVLTAESDWV